VLTLLLLRRSHCCLAQYLSSRHYCGDVDVRQFDTTGIGTVPDNNVNEEEATVVPEYMHFTF
jgi:hypothetical protein